MIRAVSCIRVLPASILIMNTFHYSRNFVHNYRVAARRVNKSSDAGSGGGAQEQPCAFDVDAEDAAAVAVPKIYNTGSVDHNVGPQMQSAGNIRAAEGKE